MNIFFASDHHLGHANILNFKRSDGSTPLRSFRNVDEMNEHMVQRHNSVVRPGDRIYMLGDITFTNKGLPLLARMNGEKILIKGNHDKLKASEYLVYFKDIRGSHQFDGVIMTHIPIHPESLARWGANIHGHLHYNRVTITDKYGNEKPDPRYYNVSVECLNDYTPVSLEEIKKFILDSTR